MMIGIADPIPDVAFASAMLAHHKGAVEMAMIELKYGTDEQMLTLARDIIATQKLEIEQLQNWLAKHRTESDNDTSLNDATDNANSNKLLKNDSETAEKPTA